jgi:DNA-directed RNA polymerase specialized sigma subunit
MRLTHAQFADLHSAGRLTECQEELIPLAKIICQEVWDTGLLLRTEVDQEDVLSWCYEGLATAVNEWTPARGVPLKTFASQRIKWHVMRIMRDSGTGKAGINQERVALELADLEEASVETEDDIICRIDLERKVRSLNLSPQDQEILDGMVNGESLRTIGDRLQIGKDKVRARQQVIREAFFELCAENSRRLH